MDYAISNWILETFGTSKAFAIISRILTYLGSTGTVIAILAVLLIFKKTRKIGFYSMTAVLLGLLINNLLLKNIVARLRPFETYTEMVKICELANYGLPTGYSMASGHATTSMAIAVSVFMQSKKSGGFAITGSVVVGLTRVCLLVHYMTDVIMGWALGAVIAIAVYYLLTLIIKKHKQKGEKYEENNSGISE